MSYDWVLWCSHCCTKYCTACDSSFIFSIRTYIMLCIKQFTLVWLARMTSVPVGTAFLRDMEKLKYLQISNAKTLISQQMAPNFMNFFASSGAFRSWTSWWDWVEELMIFALFTIPSVSRFFFSICWFIPRGLQFVMRLQNSSCAVTNRRMT